MIQWKKYYSYSLVCLIAAIVTVAPAALAQKKKTQTAKKTEQPKTPAKKKEPATLNLTKQDNTVTVTSEFAPALKDASKINFSGTTPLPAGTAPRLGYDVPAQTLFFPYIPGSLHPLALDTDSILKWPNDGFIKLGYGNYSTPYVEGGIALGNGVNSSLALHAKHTQSKGSLPLQKFAKTEADLNGVYQLGEANELTGKIFFDQNSLYAYGIRPADSALWNRDSAKLHYATYGIKLSLRNKKENEMGISYNPSLAVNLFTDNWNAHESNMILDAPISKTITDQLAIQLGVTADITSYKALDTSINNNLVYIKPALTYNTGNLLLKLGWTPTWNKSTYVSLFDLGAQYKWNDTRFILLGGFKSYFDKNTYRSLVAFNPWIQQPLDLQNTKNQELYIGFKGSAGSHFTYNGTLSYLRINDQPLFRNDSSLGNRFYTIYEPKMNDLRIHGEFGYTQAEKFSLLAGVTIHDYSNLDSNAQAWGLLPVEMNASLRYLIAKGLWLKSDLNLWNGSYYQDVNKVAQKAKGVADWNAGLEFSATKNLNVWLQVNNLLNSKYQRWNQYQTIGLNVLGGIVYNFNLKK